MPPPGGDGRTLRTIVCDDDEIVRRVVGDLVAEAGGEVIAEADTAVQATLLIDRFAPDLVVLDMNLRRGTGHEVLEHVAARAARPHVVVFTAYDAAAPATADHVDVVPKPEFEALAACLGSLRARPVERRRSVGARAGTQHRPAIDDAPAFYRVLGGARPGDVLVRIDLHGTDAAAVVDALRRVVRVQDHVLRRSDNALLLLLAGGEAAVPALCARVRDHLPDVDGRLRAVDVGDDPTGAFTTLTS